MKHFVSNSRIVKLRIIFRNSHIVFLAKYQFNYLMFIA